jgi:DNA-3-methyladenine glycosylase
MQKHLSPVNLQSAEAAAIYLLNCLVIREYQGHKLVGRIVETEAYHQADPASHSFRGTTPRTQVMFGSAGLAYTYFTYGMHWCMNVVCGAEGEGAAVLIRAIEPIEGTEQMKTLRKMADAKNLTNGPAKFAQAFAINKNLYGHDLRQPPLQIFEGEPLLPAQIVTTTRVGIRHAVDAPLRFYIKDNPFVSKP